MAKLVILTQGMTGRAHELNVDRTTIGRVEDNTFQIADPSVSSHHCEVLLRSGEIFIRDLGSTNGSFIGDARITESVLKPGQTLRLGQVELRLDADQASAPPAAAPSPAPPRPASAPPLTPKRASESTMVIPRGVSLSELETGGRGPGFDTTSSVFSKKKNKGGFYFWIVAAVGVLIIIVLIIVALMNVNTQR